MGHSVFSEDEYLRARQQFGVTDTNVTRQAEESAEKTGHLSEIVDPAINPIRRSMIRLNPHQGKWIATVGCPMDVEVSCDTTGSMGGEVDTEMKVLPDLYEEIASVLPGYDPQLCLGIFGDCEDPFVLCRPQFEMEAPKIVKYLMEMAPQRRGAGNHGEDPQYAMFARAFLTDAYTNRIGLKGYHFIITDEPCHIKLERDQIQRIFGADIFDNELDSLRYTTPNDVGGMISELKEKTHQFVLILYRQCQYKDTIESWTWLCGEKSVILIDSTKNLPKIISTIIGLTEGTVDITDIKTRLGENADSNLIESLSNIDIGAQATLRHKLPHPVPKAGDIFANKGDLWPIQPGDATEEKPAVTADTIQYL